MLKRRVATSVGLTEDTGWLDYLATEAAFVSGDWPRAREIGLRNVALGEANKYLRLTVRPWHVLIPIAGVTGDREVLEHAARWYRSLEGTFEFPDSPYSRVMRTAQDIELAAAGLWTPSVPEVEPRIPSYDDDPSGPSWSAALDRVFRVWVEAGELAGAQQTLDALTRAVERMPGVTHLGRGAHQLLAARLALARGQKDGAAAAAHAALGHFQTRGAPWWMAKTMRLIDRAGAADAPLVEEVAAIEKRLGAVTPTA